MARLTALEYRTILEIVTEAAASGSTEEPLSPRVLDTVLHLIPAADTLGFFEGAPWERPTRRVWTVGAPVPWSAADRRLMDRYRFQHPLYPTPATIGRAVRTSDFMSRRAYRKLDLYRLVGHRHGIEYSMDYWMQAPDGRVRGFSLDASQRDFTDHERLLLDVVGGHLGRVLGRFDPRLPSVAARRLTARQAEVLAWVGTGLTNREIGRRLSISHHTVRKHLEHAYERLEVHNRAASIAAVHGAANSPRTPA